MTFIKKLPLIKIIKKNYIPIIRQLNLKIMRKNLLLIQLSFLMFSTLDIYSQNIVEYDFESKNPPKMLVAKLGENSVFKIININKFLYEVKIETSQSEFNSEPPAVFSNIFQIEKKEESAITNEAKQVIDQTDAEINVKESAFSLALEKSSLEWKKLKLESFSEDLLEYKSLPDTLQDQNKISELNEKIASLKGEIDAQKNIIQELNDKIQDKYFKQTSELYSNANFVNESFEKLEEAKSIKNKLIQLSLTDGLTQGEAIVLLNAMEKEYPFVKKPEKLLTAFNSNYRNFKTNLQLYSLSQIVIDKFEKDPKKVAESTNNLKSEIESIKKKVDEYDYNQLFQNISKLFSELKNENNYFIVSDPVQAKKDIINYSISISPRKGIESLTAMESRKFTTEVPIKGGIKIDFSTGLTISSGLYDRTYNMTVSSNDSSKSIISLNNNNNIGTLSLAALMHVSKRTSACFKPGLTFGLGLNTTEIKEAQIYIGASGILGTQERFIFTIGASMANVDYLKPEFNLDQEILTERLSNDITEKTSRVGFFIGFSYNLTNKKKE